MTFIETLREELRTNENGIIGTFEIIENLNRSSYYKENYGHMRFVENYIPACIQTVKGEGGGDEQHYLFSFTNENDPTDIHYVRCDVYYNSWEGIFEPQNLEQEIYEVIPVQKMVTVYEKADEQ